MAGRRAGSGRVPQKVHEKARELTLGAYVATYRGGRRQVWLWGLAPAVGIPVAVPTFLALTSGVTWTYNGGEVDIRLLLILLVPVAFLCGFMPVHEAGRRRCAVHVFERGIVHDRDRPRDRKSLLWAARWPELKHVAQVDLHPWGLTAGPVTSRRYVVHTRDGARHVIDHELIRGEELVTTALRRIERTG
ncbi:hypothetical protein [Streptomyces celluloflavus]|uniref:hypothetical protein n=1 Tax=Streptomyces celluloflavus TaxID=58344 RepID=UPI0036980DDB